tara:strand:- start:203 stop:610 length:408 start_codon:yes stop_codon:yes gene_type:complete
MASEERLQSDIARRFSELYPDKSGQLFHVSNERNHKLQAFKARAIGIIPGVADLIYFSKLFDVATELKVNGSRHLVATIKGQIRWGRVWESQGNVWRLCTTVDEAISCYEGNFKGKTLDEVEELIRNVKTQTIKF